jgi:hypothetical protein
MVRLLKRKLSVWQTSANHKIRVSCVAAGLRLSPENVGQMEGADNMNKKPETNKTKKASAGQNVREIAETPLQRLRHHVTGAIERGEAEPIVEQTSSVPETRIHPEVDYKVGDKIVRAYSYEEAVTKAASVPETHNYTPTPEAIAADKAALAKYKATHAAALPDEEEEVTGEGNAPRELAKFGRNYIGCVIDGSAQSADYINEETIDFAETYGFKYEDLPSEDNEDYSEILSEEGDNAVSFLNDQDNLPYCSWYFEDNSLFYTPCIDNVKEDVGFCSSRETEYPADDYEGEWLHVNDHGNATLYVRTGGKDKEIWAIV